MRELKFRCWDKQTRQMSPAFTLFGEFLLIGAVHAWQYESGNKSKSSLEALNDLEVMQWTGLKDKNGKEIYEGDVVTAHNAEQVGYDNEGTEIMQDVIGKVFFEDGYFQYDGHSMGPIPLSYDLEQIEVIGNLYQNPDLLKPK
jgi:uncharacterized phage protein (TIGR01671 family)